MLVYVDRCTCSRNVDVGIGVGIDVGVGIGVGIGINIDTKREFDHWYLFYLIVRTYFFLGGGKCLDSLSILRWEVVPECQFLGGTMGRA